jgi:dTDP-4-amino-4,6-dideoxygalactose transaminase
MAMTPASASRAIAFNDLAAQQAAIRHRLDAAIARVLDHGQYIMGPEVLEFERRLAEFCGAPHAISCASGTDALILTLMSKGLSVGEAVIVPTFTFCATAEAVCLLGGIPIFADVLDDTHNLRPDSLKAAILTARRLELRLSGVITVDLFGQACDYDAIEPIVRENDLFLICDAAQAFGGTYRGRKIGTIGDVTTTSFFPAKPLGCYGDGGAVFTGDDETAELLRSLRVHGQGVNKYDNVRLGINGRLDTLQAAILIEKLAIFADEITARNGVAARYAAMLPEQVTLPTVIEGVTSTWAQYTIQCAGRDRAIEQLEQAGVPTAVYYAKPLHRQTAYRHYPRAEDHLVTADRLAAGVLSLPMGPLITTENQAHIAGVLHHVFEREPNLSCNT